MKLLGPNDSLRSLAWLAIALAMPMFLVACGSKTSPVSSASSRSATEVLYGVPAYSLLNTSIVATINPGTGGFSKISVPTVPYLGSAGVAAVGSRFLFVSVGPKIFGYSIGSTNGALTTIAGSPFAVGSGANLQGMAAAPNRYVLYVADSGSIDALSVDSTTGVPTPIAGSPFTSGTNEQLTVDPSGEFLYASDDDGTGSVLAFTIGGTGALTPVPGSPFAIPGQGATASQPVGIVDSGKFVYVALYGSNQIAAFSINSGTGALTSVPGSPFSAGLQPEFFALTGNFLYVVNERDGSISGYTINPSTGALTSIAGSPFGGDGLALAVDPAGKYLYFSLSIGINAFDIDYMTGALTPNSAGVSNNGYLWLTIVQLP